MEATTTMVLRQVCFTSTTTMAIATTFNQAIYCIGTRYNIRKHFKTQSRLLTRLCGIHMMITTDSRCGSTTNIINNNDDNDDDDDNDGCDNNENIDHNCRVHQQHQLQHHDCLHHT